MTRGSRTEPRRCCPCLLYTSPRHCVVYTGTHDNDTIMGWMHTASPEDVRFAWEYLRLTDAEGPNWGMMCGALQSPGAVSYTHLDVYKRQMPVKARDAVRAHF